MILHLRAAVQQLYAAGPGEFTALRSQLVKQAKEGGDAGLSKTIGALRKPTVAAWAVNHYVREHAEELAEFREFAELLREAQRTLDADQLRLLGRERARRVDEVADRIAQVAGEAGQRLGPGVAQEVRETLTALIGDGEAEATVLTGSLVRALSYSGFGEVDIEDAVALDPDDEYAAEDSGAVDVSQPDLTLLAGGRADPVDLEERRATKRAAVRARLATALDEARSSLRAADSQVAVLTARQEEVTEGIADLERRLETARSRLAKVTGELDEASGIRDRHEQEEAAAQRALDDHDAAD